MKDMVAVDFETSGSDGLPMARFSISAPPWATKEEAEELYRKFADAWPAVRDAMSGVKPNELIVRASVRPRYAMSNIGVSLLLHELGARQFSFDSKTGWPKAVTPTGRYNQFVGLHPDPDVVTDQRGRWRWLGFFYAPSEEPCG